MTVLPEIHEQHDATFEDRGGRQVVAGYGRPARTHSAVRNVVGVIEMAYDVLVVTGEDRAEFVDNAVSQNVPTDDGDGAYSLLLTPQGRIRTDMYIYDAGERLLVFVPPGNGESLAEDWSEKTFIQDVEVDTATEQFGVFGVHGPDATDKIESVYAGPMPDTQLSFTRGSIGEAGVTVVRTDAPTGEVGYEVVCDADTAADVFDTLENQGIPAAAFGYDAWETLTLEAGTPLFESELDGGVPNNLGLRNAVDFEKGCFVGQEVVSRVENRGRPTKQLAGLLVDGVPEAGATVFQGDETVGEVTRGLDSPTRGEPIAMGLLDQDVTDAVGTPGAFAVRVDGEERDATLVDLPLVEGTDRSGRIPRYPDGDESGS